MVDCWTPFTFYKSKFGYNINFIFCVKSIEKKMVLFDQNKIFAFTHLIVVKESSIWKASLIRLNYNLIFICLSYAGKEKIIKL